MQLQQSHRIFGLDLLRAIAILLVVCSHLVWIIPNKQGFLPDLMSISGVIGVEMFFVLSGFLIGRIIYKFFTDASFNKNQMYYFWVRRWFRTLPNYYLALILNCIVVVIIGSNLPDTIWYYAIFMQNFAWEIPAFFYESWSLSIEEFAYIIGPLLMYALFLLKPKTSRSKLFLLATISILIAFIISKLVYNFYDTTQTMQHWNINLKSSVIYRIDGIYYGVLAAYIYSTKPVFWRQLRHVGFGIGILIFLMLNLGIPLNGIFIEYYPSFWNVIYLPLNSLAIVLMLPLLSNWNATTTILMKPITKISRISYAVYVLHYSIILQLLKYYIPTEGLAGLDIVVYISVYLSLVFLISYLVYTYFEKPMTNLRDLPIIKNRFK